MEILIKIIPASEDKKIEKVYELREGEKVTRFIEREKDIFVIEGDKFRTLTEEEIEKFRKVKQEEERLREKMKEMEKEEKRLKEEMEKMGREERRLREEMKRLEQEAERLKKIWDES